MISFFMALSKGTRRILGACFLAFFFNGLMTMMMGSLLPDLKATYHLTDTQAGLMLSGHSAGNLLACFLSGLLPLWLGKRKSITMLVALAAMGFAMMLVSGNPLWLLIGFAFTGVGRGSISNFNNTTVNVTTGGSPAALNLLHSVFAVGAILAPLVFLLAGRLGGWYAAAGLIAVLGAVVAFHFSRLQLPDDQPDRRDVTQRSMVFLKNRTFMILAGMMFFYLCVEYAINGWLVTYLQNKPLLLAQFAAQSGDAQTALTTYSQAMATLLWSVILAGRLTNAALVRKWPQKRLMMLDSIGVALFFGLFLLGNRVGLVTLAVAGLGFCMAGICPMIFADASYITNRYPMGLSTLLAIGFLGGILMPVLVGVLADAYGFFGGMSVILIGVAALLVLSILNNRLKPVPVDESLPAQDAPACCGG